VTEPSNGAINEQVAALRRELKLTWDAHEREHIQHEAAHAREHQFTQTAIDTAAKLAENNKADANEWRASMTDREVKFATKADVDAILERLDKIERAGLVASERETVRIANEVEEKRDQERRQARGQWVVGLVVGLMATFGSVLINIVIRLSSGQ